MNSFSYAQCFSDPNLVRNTFLDQGVLQVKNFFDPLLCSEAIGEILQSEKTLDTNMNQPGLVTESINDKNLIKYFQGLYSVSNVFRKFACLNLLKLGSIILDTEDVFCNDIEAHIRNPGGSSIPKHQDNFYFNLQNAIGLTCYVALNFQSSENGSLQYYAKSHHKRLFNTLPLQRLASLRHFVNQPSLIHFLLNPIF